MKKLLDISSEERNRILEMHQTATRNNYLMEAPTQTPQGMAMIGRADGKGVLQGSGFMISNLYAPNETITSTIDLVNPSPKGNNLSKILSHSVELTPKGKELGINPSNIKVTYASEGVSNTTKIRNVKGTTLTTPITVTFPAPQQTFRITGNSEIVFNIKFTTNDIAKPEQVVPVFFNKGAGVQPGA